MSDAYLSYMFPIVLVTHVLLHRAVLDIVYSSCHRG